MLSSVGESHERMCCFGFLLVAEDWKLLEEEGGQNENLTLSKLTAGKLQWWWDAFHLSMDGLRTGGGWNGAAGTTLGTAR